MEKVKKIDVHAHACLFPQYAPLNSIRVSPEEVLATYDALGVEKGILLPIVSPESMAIVSSNGCICEITRRYPDRFAWFCNVDPRMGHNMPNEDLSEYLMFYKSLGAKGVGEMTTNLYADDPYMDNLFAHCAACDMPVTIHIAPDVQGFYGIIDDVGLPRLEKMLKKHPNVKILGHSQPFWAEISADCNTSNRNDYPTGKVIPGRLVELMREYGNLYCDMSAGSCCNAMTRDPDHAYRFIEEFGDRMMFGIDQTRPNGTGLGNLSDFLDNAAETGCISEKHYRGICRENAIRILKL